jgi:hypothetical protein
MPSRFPVRSKRRLTSQKWGSVPRLSLLAAVLSFISAGCAHRHTVVLPPVSAAPQPTQPATIPPMESQKPPVTAPPTTTQPSTAPTQPQPQTQTQPQTPPTATTPPADAPTKPDAAPKKPATEPTRPAAPQISPQISASDQATLENQTNQFVGDAEKNLRLAAGPDLNANQRDMVEKIRGFLSQARDAIKSSDWTRAKNLAQKAYLLSVELANSLR